MIRKPKEIIIPSDIVPFTKRDRVSDPNAAVGFYEMDMLSRDKADHDIYNPNTGYFKNPTATNLDKAVDGNRIVFNGNRAEGTMTHVIDSNGNIIFGKRCNPNDGRKRAPHAYSHRWERPTGKMCRNDHL